MSRLRYGMIIILICVMTLAGCDLPGLGGSTQGKRVLKYPHSLRVNLKSWPI